MSNKGFILIYDERNDNKRMYFSHLSQYTVLQKNCPVYNFEKIEKIAEE